MTRPVTRPEKSAWRRVVGRLGLVTLALAALFGLWAIRISTVGGPWPATSHHPRLLPFIGAICFWVLGVGAAIVVLLWVIVALWKEADLG